MAYTTIDNPELYFQVVTYTGNATGRTITLDGDEDMQPDLVWGKIRSESQDHVLVDAVRGVTKQLYSSDASVEQTEAQGLTGFASDGFTLGTHAYFNKDTATYVAWCWKETADAGFDIVGYTGNATDDVDISHSLSAVPHVIIVKNRDNTNNENWCVYHHKNTSAPETDFLKLNRTDATADEVEMWSDEVPTSSVFTIGRQDAINTSSGNHIAYLWSEKQGYSKFGSYVGNGNADGTFIYTGFKPMFFMLKSSSHGESWSMYDVKRQTYNPVSYYFPAANTNAAEATGATYAMDFLSNGIKLRGTGSGINGSGYTFIYMAFAEAPFVNSNGVPCNAR